MSCSISRIDTPNSIANLANRLGQLAFLLRVQAGGRLIEQQHLWLGRQCPDDFQMPLVAVAQAIGRLVGAILQVEQSEQFERLAMELALLARGYCRVRSSVPGRPLRLRTWPASRTLSSTFRPGNRRMF